VPTLAALWPAEAVDEVRLLIFGGEACPPELAERLAALPGATDVEHLLLPVEREGRRFDYAIVSARAGQPRSAGGS
jgi:hypothetical protein